jgi:hypothetical protein
MNGPAQLTTTPGQNVRTNRQAGTHVVNKPTRETTGSQSPPDTESGAWRIDDAFGYLTRGVEFRDDQAIYELNEKLAQGRLRLHWRRTDAAGLGQEGDVPSVSWQSIMICVSRDCTCDEKAGPIDWAAGRITARNDGRAFVQTFVSEAPSYTSGDGPERKDYPRTRELTVSERDVRMLWPKLGPAKHEDALVAAVKTRLAAGHYPGENESWKSFCDNVRKGCGAKESDRGYGDKTIQRVVGELKQAKWEI